MTLNISPTVDGPKGWKRRGLVYVGLPVGVLVVSSAVARAYDTAWIKAEEPISASKLKANLDDVQDRLEALEAAKMANGLLEERVATLEERVATLEGDVASLQDPNEVVHVEYHVSGRPTLTTGTRVNFNVHIADTHDAVTPGPSWAFTAPRAGWYDVVMTLASRSFPTGIGCTPSMRVNGEDRAWAQSNTTPGTIAKSANVLQLEVGDSVYVHMYCNGSVELQDNSNPFHNTSVSITSR